MYQELLELISNKFIFLFKLHLLLERFLENAKCDFRTVWLRSFYYTNRFSGHLLAHAVRSSEDPLIRDEDARTVEDLFGSAQDCGQKGPVARFGPGTADDPLAGLPQLGVRFAGLAAL